MLLLLRILDNTQISTFLVWKTNSGAILKAAEVPKSTAFVSKLILSLPNTSFHEDALALTTGTFRRASGKRPATNRQTPPSCVVR